MTTKIPENAVQSLALLFLSLVELYRKRHRRFSDASFADFMILLSIYSLNLNTISPSFPNATAIMLPLTAT